MYIYIYICTYVYIYIFTYYYQQPTFLFARNEPLFGEFAKRCNSALGNALSELTLCQCAVVVVLLVIHGAFALRTSLVCRVCVHARVCVRVRVYICVCRCMCVCV